LVEAVDRGGLPGRLTTTDVNKADNNAPKPAQQSDVKSNASVVPSTAARYRRLEINRPSHSPAGIWRKGGAGQGGVGALLRGVSTANCADVSGMWPAFFTEARPSPRHRYVTSRRRRRTSPAAGRE
jgi:hypothetical protein